MVQSSGIEKSSLAVGIKVAEGRAEFLSCFKDFSGGVELSVSDGVVDDLDGFEVSFEFDEIVHHGG